jgi:hypothetical protein
MPAEGQALMASTENAQIDADDVNEDRTKSARQFRRFALGLSILGVVVQIVLSAYYLGVGHAPKPRNLPVGFIGTPAQQQQVASQLASGDAFAVTVYPSPQQLTAAIRRKKAYGGLDVSGSQPHLYIASAAGPTAASLMRTAFSAAVQRLTTDQVDQLTRRGQPVPAATVKQLTAPPQITDVAPLPPNDRNGASIGFLVQALALGGTVASTGLGRLISGTRRSYRRGIGHVVTLIVYAAASAAAVLWVMTWFSVGAHADYSALYFEFLLVSLAITASTAGAVALVGPPGAALGLVYFTFGLVVSGASIPPEFLPSFLRWFGQALPTGSGASAIRDSLYFTDAPIGGPVLVLSGYVVVGVVILLVTNLLPNSSRRTSTIELRTDDIDSPMQRLPDRQTP